MNHLIIVIREAWRYNLQGATHFRFQSSLFGLLRSIEMSEVQEKDCNGVFDAQRLDVVHGLQSWEITDLFPPFRWRQKKTQSWRFLGKNHEKYRFARRCGNVFVLLYLVYAPSSTLVRRLDQLDAKTHKNWRNRTFRDALPKSEKTESHYGAKKESHRKEKYILTLAKQSNISGLPFSREFELFCPFISCILQCYRTNRANTLII